ncbi:hypothetical protein [Clostridium botulinum]|nr:hypothetical protein [Clostridium botulinum]EDT84479.1 hypothetical protein CBB_0983 [Clostridium botulinum Bf]
MKTFRGSLLSYLSPEEILMLERIAMKLAAKIEFNLEDLLKVI